MSRWRINFLFALGSILPLAFFLAKYSAGGTSSDFLAMHKAGRAILSGGAVYGASTVFPYPPHSLFLFVPLSIPPFQIALILFSVLGAGLFLWAARKYLPEGFPSVLTICTPASLFCLYFGQTGLIVGALWLLAFRGNWAAVALLTIKPHLGLLSILSLRGRSAFILTCGLIILLVVASVAVFGFRLWPDFLAALHSQASLIRIRPQWSSIGVSPAMTFGIAAWLAFALAAVLLLAKRVTPFTAATASLLISPYAFLYDMPVAALGFALTLQSRWDDLGAADRGALIAAFLSPCFVFFAPWAVPPIILWALWAQIREANRPGIRELHPSAVR